MIIVGLLIGIVVGFGLLVLTGGLLVLWGAGGNLWQRWAAFVGVLRSRSWAETQGTVTRSVVARRTWRRGVTYQAAIRYSYRVDGNELEGQRLDFDDQQDGTLEEAQATAARFPVGSSQRVFYDPRLPRFSTLARNVPSVVTATLGWLFVLLIGTVVAGLGVDIIFGAFQEPPNLGELPSLRAQVGGLLVGLGMLALGVAGLRALLERKTRRMLRYLASAKQASAGDVRAGDCVAVFGRAEEDTQEADDEIEDEEELEPSDADELALPFAEGNVFYAHTDLGSPDSHLTRFSPFAVRDQTGSVRVELSPGRSLLDSQQVPIVGEVEQWLDRHELELGSWVSADRRATMKVERLREGDSVLVVGQAFRESRGRVVLRAQGDEPLTLIFADVPWLDAVRRLRRAPRTTLAVCAAGSLSIIAGAIALLA